MPTVQGALLTRSRVRDRVAGRPVDSKGLKRIRSNRTVLWSEGHVDSAWASSHIAVSAPIISYGAGPCMTVVFSLFKGSVRLELAKPVDLTKFKLVGSRRAVVRSLARNPCKLYDSGGDVSSLLVALAEVLCFMVRFRNR